MFTDNGFRSADNRSEVPPIIEGAMQTRTGKRHKRNDVASISLVRKLSIQLRNGYRRKFGKRYRLDRNAHLTSGRRRSKGGHA
jgi:hypothetical protein